MYQDLRENVVIVATDRAEAATAADMAATADKAAATGAATTAAARKAAETEAAIIGVGPDNKAEADLHTPRVRSNLHRKEAAVNDITEKS